MGKRLTDMDKWDKIWFRKLSPLHKCFWGYILDKCNHAGIWEVDFETAEHYIGSDLSISEIQTAFEKQYMELDNGKKWFINDFIEFQYGVLTEANKMYNPVISALSKEGIDYPAYMGHISPIDGGKVIVKDKVKVKDKVIVKDNNKIKYAEFVEMTEVEYKSLTDKYGKELTNKAIDVLDNGKGSKGYKYKSDYRAILSWALDKAKEDLGKGKKPELSNALHANPDKYKGTF